MPTRSRLFPVLLLLGFVVAAVLLMAYRRSGEELAGGLATAELPDGSRLRLWKASFGTNHELVLGRFPELDGLRRRFPRIQRVLGGMTERIRGGWSGDGLCLFYSWVDGLGVPKPNPPWVQATVDEHGCSMEMDSGRGESSFGGTNIAHQYSLVYPRRASSFEVAFRGEGDSATGGVRMLIQNPRPWQGTSWVPEAVPASRVVDGLQVTYLGFAGSDRWPWPRFRVEANGQERPEWKVGRIYYRDVTGNESQSVVLCRHEAAWEIEASFERVPGSGFGPDEAWTIHTGALPGPGEAKELEGDRTLQGLTVAVGAMGGPGRFEFENVGGDWVLVSSAVLTDGDRGAGSSWGSDSGREWMKLRKSKPWVMLDLKGLSRDLTWKVVVRDGAGRSHPNQGWSGSGSRYTTELEVPDDASVSQVQILVQRWRTVAFRVPPPEIPDP